MLNENEGDSNKAFVVIKQNQLDSKGKQSVACAPTADATKNKKRRRTEITVDDDQSMVNAVD